MLNSSGENGHPCLVPDFRGNAFNFSLLRIMFAVDLSYMAFIIFRYVPSMPAFWRVFIINGFNHYKFFVGDCLILMMSSVTFSRILSHQKSGTGWLLPLHGKWGWWKRNLRKNQDFGALCMLFKLEFLWKGKWTCWYIKTKFKRQKICLIYQYYESPIVYLLRKTVIISIPGISRFRTLWGNLPYNKKYFVLDLFLFILN